MRADWPGRIWVLLSLLSGLLGGVRAAEVESPEELLQRVRQSILVISQAGRGGGWDALGTGFVVGEGLVATSLHVIGEGRSFRLAGADGTTHEPLEIRAWDRKSDLALVRIAATNLPVLRLADSDNVQQGRKIFALGSPQGLKFSAVEGIVSAIREFEMGPMLQLAMPVEPGNSGGPVFDQRGRVLGVVSMKSTLSDNVAFAVPGNHLRRMIEKPNPMALQRWLAFGALPETEWEPRLGATWRKRGGTIQVHGAGAAFGGRALCIASAEPPGEEFELSVRVRLDDESQAAGLAFGISDDDHHFGFYPTAGKFRLTHFDGPTVYSWKILEDAPSGAYRAGDWNLIRVAVAGRKVSCFVNGEKLFERELEFVPKGRVGLAKFRDTSALFKGFAVRGSGQSSELSESEKLLARARELDKEAEELRGKAEEKRLEGIQRELAQELKEGKPGSLARAALWVAALDLPELEPAAYERELADLGGLMKKALEGKSELSAKIEAFNRVFFEESGFHGSRLDYYSFENSHLSAVIDDREGIPLTLAIVYLDLARRAGLEGLSGLAFPGHFMVGFNDGAAGYIDVFDEGRMVREDQIYRVVNERSEVPLQEKHFKPATEREMISRMLQNLIALALDRRERERALRYLDAALAIAPDDAVTRFRRAFVRLELGQKEKAAGDLEMVIEARPAELDLERLRELLERARGRTGR